MPPSRPFVRLNAAITADGKIAPANRVFVPFGSRRDHDLLYRLRAQSDAVMAGARTVDLYPTTLGPGSKTYRSLRLRKGLPEYNLRIVVSGSGTLDPKAEIFKKRHSPIILLTSEKIPDKKAEALPITRGRRGHLREERTELSRCDALASLEMEDQKPGLRRRRGPQ